MKLASSRGRMLLRLGINGLFLAAVGLVAQSARDATLSVRILDGATGQPTPVRVSLQDASGNRPRVTGAVSVSESAIPIPKQALAVMWGQQDRAQGYALQPDGSFYVDGAFDVDLPPGTYTITMAKGFEYERQVATVEIRGGAALSREYRLQRWIDMPARGWYSADDHIHLRRSPGDNAAIARWIAAEDVHVGNILEMGDFWATYFSQYAFGAAGRYEEAGRILSPGQEEPRTPEVGHTISLGASQFVRFRGDYYAYDQLFDRVHELGGVTGFAHQAMSFHGYRGMVLNTLRGKTDFLELAQFCVPEGPLAVEHYYLFLNLGVKVTALGGSDFPWCGKGPVYGFPAPPVAQIGNARFYAYTAGPLSYDRWFAALKGGRTFVTTGPIVLLTVNGHGPGDEVDVAPGTKLHVTAEAFGHDSQVPLRTLEIIGHGKVLARATSGTRARLSVDLDLAAEHGIWIAAKSEAGMGQVAHTTPVYVTVNGDGFHNRATASENMAVAEKYLQELEQELASPGTTIDSQVSRHRAQLERQIGEARTKLKTLSLR
jgi:hypothetical protein